MAVLWPKTSFVRGLEEIAALKQQPGKDIYLVGGARTTASLIDAGLVDEPRLIIYTSRHAVLARDWRHRTFRHREELLLGHTAPVLCQQTLRINLHTGRIRGKGVSLHVGVGLFNRTAVYLKLHSIAVRILVVKR